MPAHARAAVVSMEARYKKLHAAGKEQEANEFRLGGSDRYLQYHLRAVL